MAWRSKILILLTALVLGATSLAAVLTFERYWSFRDRAAGLAEARRVLAPDLAARGLRLGSPVFMRIFKESRELEVWLQQEADGRWRLFRSYPICNYSGGLGPKLREGDRQSPEGLYQVRLSQLHPTSQYHLAFNLGFPNGYDRANGRTGSYLMVHGNCVSVGCYAMTDRGIEQIYALAEAALENGQDAFPVQAFPARLSAAWLTAHEGSPWIGFWRDHKPCYDAFEETGQPPGVRVESKRYVYG